MIARSAAGGVDESINLDVVALEELKKKATPTTNDLPKYNYQADAEGNYCKCYNSCKFVTQGRVYVKATIIRIIVFTNM